MQKPCIFQSTLGEPMSRQLSGVARKLRNLRTRLQVTQKELSQASGVSIRTIRRLENMDYLFSVYVPKTDTLENIAQSFGVELDVFLSNSISEILDKLSD